MTLGIKTFDIMTFSSFYFIVLKEDIVYRVSAYYAEFAWANISEII
jgi:hypothetical protein